MSLDRHAVVRAPMERLGSLPTPIPTPPPPGAQPPPPTLPPPRSAWRNAGGLLPNYSVTNILGTQLCSQSTLHLNHSAPNIPCTSSDTDQPFSPTLAPKTPRSANNSLPAVLIYHSILGSILGDLQFGKRMQICNLKLKYNITTT